VADDKTEKATPKRKEDARKKGQIFLSQEVVTVATLLAAFYGVKAYMPSIVNQTEQILRSSIEAGATTDSLTISGVLNLLTAGFLVIAKTTLIPLLLVCLAAIVATMGQTKLYFSSQGFAFKADRLNPLSGLKRLFSMRGLVELLKSLLKIIVLGWMIYSVLETAIPQMARLFSLPILQAAQQTGNLIMTIVEKAVIAFAFLSAADYFYQWWDYEKNLRMSKQEIKDEYKQMEGDPQVKSRQRNIAQQRARRRMMQKVPQADVVIRNPTHLAIAIQYDRDKDHAPRVIAKGADDLALRIVKVAEEHHVYTLEDKPLAHALYDAVDIDQEIPEKFYQPVAKILAFVYSLKKKESKE
jgi:flagellar biosynthetic protein FlhB